MNNTDSLKKRYFYKLFANIFAQVIGVINFAIVPRGLGPRAYGDFNFLSNFFAQLTNFFDMGTSVCFYNKLSQRTRDFGLVSFYLYFMGIASSVIIGFIAVSHLTSIDLRLWPNQQLSYIYLAAGCGIIIWVLNLLNKMTDAYGLTVPAEMARIFQKIIGVVLIILLYVFQQLNLKNYFYYQYVISFFSCGMLIWIIKTKGYFIREGWKIPLVKVKSYLKEFYLYSNPLFFAAVVGLIVGILDRWLLQVYGGSIQQGFFGFSFQIGTLCFLFTGAMTPLLMREFSISFINNDLKQMTSLFRRYIPLMYSITAFLSCFIAIQAKKVIYIIGGNKYIDALIPVTIMAFCPIHQTYGQLSSSMILAAGQTRLHRNIDIISMLIGLPVTYFLIAPKERWGMNAGATGLAIKTVLVQFICVNLYLFFNTKFLKLNFWRYLWHQIFSVVCLILIAIFSTFITDTILRSQSVIFTFLLTGFLYTFIVIALIYYLPSIFGLKKEDIQWINKTIYHKLKINREGNNDKS